MIGLYVSIGRQRSKRFDIAKERVTIGSDASNDLVLRDGDVAPFHGTLARVRDRWFLSLHDADAFSSNRMRALEDGARIQAGRYTIVIAAAQARAVAPAEPPARLAAGTPAGPLPAQRAITAPSDPPPRAAMDPADPPEPRRLSIPPMPPPWGPDPLQQQALDAQAPVASDPIEQSLIDAIARGDEASRLVYADWLEGRGDALRAEFLRLQRALDGMEPTDPAQRGQLKARLGRLNELAPQIDLAWRRMVGRPVVEGCDKVVADFKCKMDWGALAPTDQPNVRRCNACGDNVYYVTTIRTARDHVRAGHCVVVDFGPERRPRDLEGEDPLVAMRSPRPGPAYYPFPPGRPGGGFEA